MVSSGTFTTIQDFGTQYFTGLEWAILDALPNGFTMDVWRKFFLVVLIGLGFVLLIRFILQSK